MSIEASYRGYLPHIDGASHQFISFRLADSLPISALEQIHLQTDIKKRIQLTERFLDHGYGSCLLGRAQNAEIVMQAFHYFHKKRYDLVAFVVMPNHVHVLIAPYQDEKLSKIVHSWKSYTSKIINEKDQVSNRTIWMPDYWDRYIRDEKHFWQVIDYIRQNPVKAGLVERAEDWKFSSASAKTFA